MAQQSSHVVSLIEQIRGPRSATALGNAIGVRQLRRKVHEAARTRTLDFRFAEAIAGELGVDIFEVVAAFAADCDVDLGAGFSPEARGAAHLVMSLPPADRAAFLKAMEAMVEFYSHDRSCSS